ncbi:MAG TPA: hypothetical protein VEY51_17925 [Chondromyces sp.]|nr:hypothetical protein [Chondromyces sp.]
MRNVSHQIAAVEWKNDHIVLYDYQTTVRDRYKKIHTLEEAKELIKNCSEEYTCLIISIYGLALAAASYEVDSPKELQSKLAKDFKSLALYQKDHLTAITYLNRLIKAAAKSKSVNGSKTDIMHEAIRIQIELEEKYAIKQTS